MSVQFSSGQGVMTRQTYRDNIDKQIELLWMRQQRVVTKLKPFFADVTAESTSLKMSSVSNIVGMPVENEDTAEPPYVQPAPEYPKTFDLTPYRLFIRVTDTMIRADRHSKIMSMTTGLTQSANERLEYLRAGIFNNAFTGTAGADAKPLVDDAHDHPDKLYGTWDNESTGALTGSNLQAGRLLADNMTKANGTPDPVDPVTFVGPTALRQKVNELTGSSLRAEDSLNAKTVLISDYEIVISPHLSSTTAWFLMGNRVGEEKGMYEVYLMRPEMKDAAPQTDMPINKRIKFIVKIDFTTSQNIIGSLGT